MEIREAVHPEHMRRFTGEELRRHFLITNLFPQHGISLVYSAYDRLIVGGVRPAGSVVLSVDQKILGAAYLLERRELGLINIGGPGAVTVDGRKYALGERDGLYVGRGAREISLSSGDPTRPARFYFNSAPAHRTHPTALITHKDAARQELGSPGSSNERVIHKYIHPDGVQSCQLVMGLTVLKAGSVWNTMPPHTHGRRMEAYLYFDLPQDGVVFHLMGEPSETRHIVVREGEAVLCPSWSIHAGVGTAAYSFIWGMAGENQIFTDMDGVAMADLR